MPHSSPSAPVNEFYQDIRASSGSWQGWAPLAGFNGASSFEGPAQATTGMPDGSSQVLGVGTNGLLYHDIRNASGSWQGWQPLKGYNGNTTFTVDSGYATGSVAITDLPVPSTSSQYGTSEVLAIGQDDRVYYNSRNQAGTWAGFSQVPGLNGAANFAAQKVAITGRPDGSSVVAAISTDNGEMYTNTLSASGAWGTWTLIPGYNGPATFSGPDVALSTTPNGTVELLAAGVNDVVYLNSLTSSGTWQGWQELAGYNGSGSFQVDPA